MKNIRAFQMIFVLLLALTACSGGWGTPIETTTPHIHSFSPATCTEPGKCVCGEINSSPLGHHYSDATCTAPQTCTACGETKGTILEHDYSDATCTQPQTCTGCGKTKGTALGHNYSETTCTAPATCTVCSATEGEALPHAYVLGECTVCQDYSETYCPKLYFTGDMSEMTSKKDIRNISFEYRSRQQIVSGTAKIKVQGTSSLRYAKKNYTINFYEDEEYLQKMGLDVGWGAQSEYCLKANWIDKTHARNVVTAKLVSEVQAKYGVLAVAPNHGAIDGFPVEIYINGEFHGLYTMNIPKAAWMFGMDENNPNHIVLCGEKWSALTLFNQVPTNFASWGVEVGPTNAKTLAKLQRLVAFIRNSSDEEFRTNFSQYLDLDATLNYYIMMNYGWMPDNRGKNMLLVTYDGNVWYPSLYDLDTTWGADWQGKSLYDYQNSLLTVADSRLWERMETLYQKEIAARYFELRSTVLDTDYVIAKFNNFYNSIPEEVLTRETEKWATSKRPISGYPISQIEEYIQSVIPRLDAKYEVWKETTIPTE